MNIQTISTFIFSGIILGIPLVGLIKRIAIFESFLEGGRHGFDIIIKIVPFIVGMFVAIGMVQASGAFTVMNKYLGPILNQVGFPSELLPLALIRPVSGSGSIAMLADTIEQYGPDSFLAQASATILGSTETTFYVIAIYFGAIGIKQYRHAITVGLLADLAGIIASIAVCRYFLT